LPALMEAVWDVVCFPTVAAAAHRRIGVRRRWGAPLDFRPHIGYGLRMQRRERKTIEVEMLAGRSRTYSKAMTKHCGRNKHTDQDYLLAMVALLLIISADEKGEKETRKKKTA